MFETLRRNLNCTLHHFLRFQKFPRETGSRLCYAVLIWRTYLMSLILPFLYPQLFISKYQKRVWPNKRRRYLFKALTTMLTISLLLLQCLDFFFCPWILTQLLFTNGEWKETLEDNFLSKLYSFCQFQVWDTGGQRGILWFLKRECCENLFDPKLLSLNDGVGIRTFVFHFDFTLSQFIIDFKYFCSDTLYFSFFFYWPLTHMKHYVKWRSV